jgi:hypothetical protein
MGNLGRNGSTGKEREKWKKMEALEENGKWKKMEEMEEIGK